MGFMHNKKAFKKGHQELEEKVVHVGRCAKVVKGGRRFRFAVLMVVGDGKGKVGVGLGKASEVVDARAKATAEARRNMIKIPLRGGRTLHHNVRSKFCAGKMEINAAPPGTGVIAGGAARAMFEVLGVQDVVAKAVGSTNPHAMLNATLKGLVEMKSIRAIAEKRGKKVSELTARS